MQQKRFEQGKESPFLLAVTYARLAEQAQALQYLQMAYDRHDPMFLSIRVDQALYPLHQDATYRSLLVKSGLPPLS